MPDKKLKVLCVHGLGDHRASDWNVRWPEAIDAVFPIQGVSLQYEFLAYDDIFETVDISFAETAVAAAKLTVSGIGSIFRRHRGVVGDISEKTRWTAGYVVAWVEDDGFREQSRRRVLAAIRTHRPDVILAHSLGSLVTYNAFTHPDAKEPQVAAILKRATYVTFGSQINNPFVIRNTTNGRVQELAVAFWHHLYNEHDDVFTAPIRNWRAPNFNQTETPFDDEGVGDHAATSYFRHRNTVENVWRPIGAAAVGAKAFGSAPTVRTRAAAAKRRKQRRALLVGINDYPDPAQRLEGCVNDVFLMSSVLQECGFPPETIRTCLDRRADTEGILSRLRWLLDETGPGDELVFYFSGHGARIPEYGECFEPDHYVEALVPWDFDWSPGKAITDDQIYCLYAQLPYEARLMMVFDCCHSGGIHRDGAARARGITPPDDVRHRELKWDRKTQMWVPRAFRRLNEDFTSEKDVAVSYFGHSGTNERLGRAGMLRGLSSAEYDALKTVDPDMAKGPYLPLIIEACGEEQLSYEYRHGATSYGAFTYSLASVLRRERSITFADLVGKTREQLADLQYDQVPQILGPTAVMNAKAPFLR